MDCSAGQYALRAAEHYFLHRESIRVTGLPDLPL